LSAFQLRHSEKLLAHVMDILKLEEKPIDQAAVILWQV
jgi:hypothetical protein